MSRPRRPAKSYWWPEFKPECVVNDHLKYNRATKDKPEEYRLEGKEHKMRFPYVCLVILSLIGVAAAQIPPSSDLHLRGDRFKPLAYDQMTPEQKTMVEHVLSGDRGSMNGPYNVLLRSPEMGDMAQKYGAQTRFHSSIPQKLNELAIMMTA